MNVLVWFKRDLRTADHAALTLGAGLGSVLPLYIVEPDYWALPDTSARQWDFTAECLTGLSRDLATLGAGRGGGVERTAAIWRRPAAAQP